MVKSGIVKALNRAENTGVIEGKDGREYFFSINECCDLELPRLWATVTFVKDPDYKSTNVAALVKQSHIGRRAA